MVVASLSVKVWAVILRDCTITKKLNQESDAEVGPVANLITGQTHHYGLGGNPHQRLTASRQS